MSIRDIAKRAGVSPATVSRVLNDPTHHCSSEGLRDRIWQIAREMNYLPNEAARNLKMGASAAPAAPGRIDVIVTRASPRQPDPFFSEVLRVIESETHAQRLLILHVWYLSALSGHRPMGAGVTERELAGVIGSGVRRGDGLIVIGKCAEPILERLRDAYGGNVMAVGRNSTGYVTDEVICDGEKIARVAVEHLIGLGHREIGYVGDCHNESRYRGYQRTLVAHGLDVTVANVVECEHTEAAGYAAMGELMRRDDAPTALFCATDAIAVGVLRRMGESGGMYYSPSVISSDDIEQAQLTNPGLTTVALPKVDMGRFAVRMLADRMAGGHTATARLELGVRLIVRASCSSPDNARGFTYVI